MFRQAVPVTFALALLAGCATGPTVTVDSDPSANVSAYRSYSWTYRDVPQGMNPLMYQRVRQAIDANLAARGYSKAEQGDFAVGFTLGARDKVQVDDFGPYGAAYPGYGMGYGMGYGRGWARPYSPVEVRNVTEGTLAIDIYDTGTKKPVWHGVATQEIGTNVSPEQVETAVAAVLAKFAPAATPKSN